MTDPRVVSVSSFIGNGPPRYYLPEDPENPNASFAQIVINTTSYDEVNPLAVEIEPARGLYWYAAHAFDQVPEDAERTAALAKAHLSERAMHIALGAVDFIAFAQRVQAVALAGV